MSLYITFILFYATATTDIYTLSLHDALPISFIHGAAQFTAWIGLLTGGKLVIQQGKSFDAKRILELIQEERSEEHTSELQSRRDLVCRLLLEKKKKKEYYKLINY